MQGGEKKIKLGNMFAKLGKNPRGWVFFLFFSVFPLLFFSYLAGFTATAVTTPSS